MDRRRTFNSFSFFGVSAERENIINLFTDWFLLFYAHNHFHTLLETFHSEHSHLSVEEKVNF